MKRKSPLTRTLSPKLFELSKQFPALAILGPRQSGKTTLAKMLFPEYRYINLEAYEEQEFAEKDPLSSCRLIYAGDEKKLREGIQIVPWRAC